MPKLKLDLSSDDEGESLKINDAYANHYDNWRRLEEMQKCNFLCYYNFIFI
jgi:hypothetical protein